MNTRGKILIDALLSYFIRNSFILFPLLMDIYFVYKSHIYTKLIDIFDMKEAE